MLILLATALSYLPPGLMKFARGLNPFIVALWVLAAVALFVVGNRLIEYGAARQEAIWQDRIKSANDDIKQYRTAYEAARAAADADREAAIAAAVADALAAAKDEAHAPPMNAGCPALPRLDKAVRSRLNKI